jgi:hypothetical protein
MIQCRTCLTGETKVEDDIAELTVVYHKVGQVFSYVILQVDCQEQDSETETRHQTQVPCFVEQGGSISWSELSVLPSSFQKGNRVNGDAERHHGVGWQRLHSMTGGSTEAPATGDKKNQPKRGGWSLLGPVRRLLALAPKSSRWTGRIRRGEIANQPCTVLVRVSTCTTHSVLFCCVGFAQ